MDPRAEEGAPMPTGSRCLSAPFDGGEIPVYAYRPARADGRDVALLFPGMRRNAAGLRDKAIALCEATGLVVYAPLLDAQRFPRWRYQHGGVARDGALRPPEEWTAPLLQGLVDWTWRQCAPYRPRLRLFGHSAGGQLLSRVCAYAPLDGVERYVVSNPSSHVLPLHDESPPYGFAGIGDAAALRAYLGARLTLYLGGNDTGGANLARGGAARQGANRLERGRHAYQLARRVARELGMTLNWRLIEASGVGHSSREMLAAPACRLALGLEARAL